MLETHLLDNDTTPEGKVFYLKMAGDYHRYLAEFAVDGDSAKKRSLQANQACAKYEEATRVAARPMGDDVKKEDQGLPPTNPIRLGLCVARAAATPAAPLRVFRMRDADRLD